MQTTVSEAELARARAQVKASLLMSLESTGSRCEQLARQFRCSAACCRQETVGKLNAVTTDECAARRPAVPRDADAGGMGPAERVPGLADIVGDAGRLTVDRSLIVPVDGLCDHPGIGHDDWRQVAQRASFRRLGAPDSEQHMVSPVDYEDQDG